MSLTGWRRRLTISGLLVLALAACGPAANQQAATAPPLDTAVPDPGPLPATATPPAGAVLPTALPTLASVPGTFSGEQALRYAETQLQWQPRDTGTPGGQANGDWIIQTLVAAGWQVEEQYFGVPENTSGRNIIAKRGSGPLVLIGSHYDSRRFADQDPDIQKRQLPVPAANDGASGAAVLLELARVLTPERLNEEVWLVFFDAEDNGDIAGWGGTLGSAHMARRLPRAPAAVVVVDMIGAADQQIYLEQSSTEALRAEIWQVAADLKYAAFIPQVKHSLTDGHSAFLAQGYPAIDVVDFDYPHRHTTADTLDKLSAPALESVGRTLEVWLTRD
ncbi:MAG TPA: M28 family peptidase [Herpetosiphonaceae bacterium]|nr:M28 family peptidase [Herpetosiphonaceae bacterium]